MELYGRILTCLTDFNVRTLTRLLFIAILVTFSIQKPLSAQGLYGEISGSILDSITASPLSSATIMLRTVQDSDVVQSTEADDNGGFRLKNVPDGAYSLSITHLGYRSFDTTITVTEKNKRHLLGNIVMAAGAIELNPVTIEEQKPPVSMNGDTLQYNASSYQTHENAVVEDLLKKLPGVDVDEDGNITAQGETVLQILVDGKPFFGDDPKITTKNLPADMIDQIQVFDKTSDQAAFTGIHDGNTRKTINLIIKKNRRKGTFGRATAGYGSDDRYTLNGMVNRFDNDRRVSVLAGANNINSQGFTMRGGGSQNSGRGGGGRGGITTSQMGGINYRDDWGKKVEVNGSYFVSHSESQSEQRSNRQNILPDSSFFTNQNSTSTSKTLSHRFNFNIDYTIDSMSALIFRPSLSYTASDNASVNSHESLSDKQEPINGGTRSNTTHSTSPNMNGTLLYRRRLHKKGRTFSIGLNGSYNNNDNVRYNQSENHFYTPIDSTSVLDQRNNNSSESYNWGVRFTYTEPIYTDHYLELEYSYDRNNSNSDRNTYNYSQASKKYDDYDSTYSNAFRNTFSSNRGSLNFIANKLKYDYTIGISLKENQLENNWLSLDSTLTRTTLNLYPLFNFHYNFSQGTRLRLEYRGNTRPPSISELQPVPDNSNSLRVRLGNPDLKTSFTNDIRVNFTNINQTTYQNFQASLSFSSVSNQIVNSSYYDAQRVQYIQPVNVSGIYDINGDISYSFPLKKINLKIDPATSLRYSHDVGFVNQQKNFTRNVAIGQTLRLTYDINDLLDLNINGRINYNKVTYSLLPNQNQDYFNYGLSTDFEFRLPAGFLLGSNLRYTANSGLAFGYNRSTMIWNGYVAKQLFKKKQGTIKLEGSDLLNQRLDIRRTIGSTYIQDSESSGLGRYYMLSFTYNFNRFGGRRPGQMRGGNRDRDRSEFRNGRSGGRNGGGGARGPAGGGGFRR
jgi:hypothetical protein